MSRFRALFVLLGALLALAAPGSVFAHAYLERSSPAGNTVVETAPRRVQLWFTERPELRFSEVTIYTADGQQVQHGPLALAPDDPKSLVFDVDQVPNGTYTVAWKTLSIDDGHTSAGAFAYAVGLDQPAPTAASIFVPASQAADVGRPSALAVVSRWLGYAGAALAAGGLFFVAFVLRPALRPARRGPTAPPGPVAAGRLTRLAWAGVGLSLLGALGWLVAQALAVGGALGALPATLLDLLGTRGGILIGARVLALAVLAVALRRLARRAWVVPRGDWAVPLGLLAGGGLLLAQALGSHAAATAIWTEFTVAADWAHLVGMTVWLGGLAGLALVVPAVLAAQPDHERPALLAGVARRFSAVAVWCIGLLVATGLYQSWVQVGQVDGLVRTSYGQALLVKLALVVPLLLLGALNLLVSKPGLARVAAVHARQAGERFGPLARRFRLAVRGEVALGLAVLLVTGLLTNLPPAREALLQMGRAQTRTVQLDTVKATLTVDPAVAGLNTYDVALVGHHGQPIVDAERVALRFSHTQHDMGVSEAVLQSRGDGHYTTQGSYLSMAGLWDVEVVVRLAGEGDLTATLEIPAADPSAASLARAAQVPSLGTTFLLGLELLAAALVLAVFGRRLRLPLARPLNRLLPRLGAVALGLAGLYFVGSGLMNDLTPTVALANPIPPTPASLARGEQVYQENCLACHGEFGRGDGPAGRQLHPRPADLRVHTTQHTEGQLYWWISKGFPGSAMPAFEDQLSEEDRWNVLNFIVQSFRPEAEQTAGGATAPSGAGGR